MTTVSTTSLALLLATAMACLSGCKPQIERPSRQRLPCHLARSCMWRTTVVAPRAMSSRLPAARTAAISPASTNVCHAPNNHRVDNRPHPVGRKSTAYSVKWLAVQYIWRMTAKVKCALRLQEPRTPSPSRERSREITSKRYSQGYCRDTRYSCSHALPRFSKKTGLANNCQARYLPCV